MQHMWIGVESEFSECLNWAVQSQCRRHLHLIGVKLSPRKTRAQQLLRALGDVA